MTDFCLGEVGGALRGGVGLRSAVAHGPNAKAKPSAVWGPIIPPRGRVKPRQSRRGSCGGESGGRAGSRSASPLFRRQPQPRLHACAGHRQRRGQRLHPRVAGGCVPSLPLLPVLPLEPPRPAEARGSSLREPRSKDTRVRGERRHSEGGAGEGRKKGHGEV